MPIVDQEKAIQSLKRGEVVALPTETVYGLAGLIENESALHKIFSTKERPFFDPLIVHVKDIEKAQSLAQWDPVSEVLAQKFWPGPLSLVLNKTDRISDLITSGGSTVALRCPAHPISQEILDQLPSAFAAPSANRFGHTSPTTAQHVINEFNNEVMVVDGGSSEKGIESTIVQVDTSNKSVVILRPGLINSDDFKKTLEENNISYKVEVKKQNHVPGHLKNHYQPKVSLALILSEKLGAKETEAFLNKELNETFIHWSLPENPVVAARQLYADLRTFSAEKTPIFLFLKPEWKDSPQWSGIIDRLNKACHFYLDIDTNGDFLLSNKH